MRQEGIFKLIRHTTKPLAWWGNREFDDNYQKVEKKSKVLVHSLSLCDTTPPYLRLTFRSLSCLLIRFLLTKFSNKQKAFFPGSRKKSREVINLFFLLSYEWEKQVKSSEKKSFNKKINKSVNICLYWNTTG